MNPGYREGKILLYTFGKTGKGIAAYYGDAKITLW